MKSKSWSVLFLYFILVATSVATASDCDKALEIDYAASVSELAQSLVALEKMEIENANLSARKAIALAISAKQKSLIGILGEDQFDIELSQALSRINGRSDNERVERKARRKKATKQESYFDFTTPIRKNPFFQSPRLYVSTPGETSFDLKYMMSFEKGQSAGDRSLYNVDQPETPLQIGNFGMLQFSPDGKYFISVKNFSVAVIETETGREIHKLQLKNNFGPREFIVGIQFSPNGRNALITTSHHQAFNSVYGAVYILDIISGKIVLSLNDANERATSAEWSANGAYATVAVSNKGIIWEAKTGRQLHLLLDPTEVFYSVQISHDGTRAITTSSVDSVRIWDIQLPIRKLSARSLFLRPQIQSTGFKSFFALAAVKAYFANQDSIAVVFSASDMKFIDIKNQGFKELKKVKIPFAAHYSIDPSGTYVASSMYSDNLESQHNLEIWKIASGESIEQIDLGSNVRALELREDLLFVSTDKAALLFGKAKSEDTE